MPSMSPFDKPSAIQNLLEEVRALADTCTVIAAKANTCGGDQRDPDGRIASLADRLGEVTQRVETLGARIEEVNCAAGKLIQEQQDAIRAHAARFTTWESYALRLEQAIPMIAATEDIVRGLKDWCEGRFSTIHSEYASARSFVSNLLWQFKQASEVEVARALREIWRDNDARRTREEAASARPSRLRALRYALTGGAW